MERKKSFNLKKNLSINQYEHNFFHSSQMKVLGEDEFIILMLVTLGLIDWTWIKCSILMVRVMHFQNVYIITLLRKIEHQIHHFKTTMYTIFLFFFTQKLLSHLRNECVFTTCHPV